MVLSIAGRDRDRLQCLGRFAADLITQQHPVAHRWLEADALARLLCGRPRD